MRKEKIKFIDAQKMAKENPDTFYAPSLTELNEIKEGSLLKVATGGERFWVLVISVKGNKIIGKVDNDLICTDKHGLQCDDEVEFEKKNVYSIYSIFNM